MRPDRVEAETAGVGAVRFDKHTEYLVIKFIENGNFYNHVASMLVSSSVTTS